MLTFALPLIFLLIPLPFVLWYFFPNKEEQTAVALKVPFYEAIASRLQARMGMFHQSNYFLPFFIVWLLLLLALAGPQWVGKPYPQKREGLNILLALDLSGSMELKDMLLHGRPISRLDVVKRAAAQFVNDRKNDKIGLILFGAQAYLQTPLTYDHQNVLQRIDDATVGLAGKTTSIGDALGLAIKRLQHTPKKGRVVVLLTDGVNNSGVLDPLRAAHLAHHESIKVYTIGLGVPPNSQLTDDLFISLKVTADLDEETLKKIANITHGHYFRATNPQSLYRVYKTINQMEAVSQEEESVRPRHDYYAWPLACAFFLFLYTLNRVGQVFYRRARLPKGGAYGG